MDADGALSFERNWSHGEVHGIERMWDNGTLRSGYPEFYIHGDRVTKEQYQTACATDAPLPPYRMDDGSRARCFPPEVAIHLRRSKPPLLDSDFGVWYRGSVRFP